MKITRKLTKELHAPRKPCAQTSVASMCQLQMQLNCCDGKGYTLNVDGPRTRARLCKCVEGCGACKGQARFLKSGVSVPCRDPNPVHVVGTINQAAVPSRYGFSSLNRFNNFSGNGRQIVHRVADWSRSYHRQSKRGLVIEGPVGVGKTFMLTAVTMSLAMRQISVRFVDFFELLTTLKAGYSNNKADDSILRPLIDVDVLVIDELGKGRNSDWELSILDQLVMGRYNQNKVILASTNYSTQGGLSVGQDINPDRGPDSRFRESNFDQSLEERVGQRIFSRLVETCDMVRLEGDDYRRRFLSSTSPNDPSRRTHL